MARAAVGSGGEGMVEPYLVASAVIVPFWLIDPRPRWWRGFAACPRFKRTRPTAPHHALYLSVMNHGATHCATVADRRGRTLTCL